MSNTEGVDSKKEFADNPSTVYELSQLRNCTKILVLCHSL